MARRRPLDVEQHLDRLYRAALALCGDRDDAEDLVQETCARVLARPRDVRRDDALPYLLGALRNVFLNEQRTRSRRPQTVAGDGRGCRRRAVDRAGGRAARGVGADRRAAGRPARRARRGRRVRADATARPAAARRQGGDDRHAGVPGARPRRARGFSSSATERGEPPQRRVVDALAAEQQARAALADPRDRGAAVVAERAVRRRRRRAGRAPGGRGSRTRPRARRARTSR